MEKLNWYETYKIDSDIESDILEGINKITQEYREYKKNNKKK